MKEVGGGTGVGLFAWADMQTDANELATACGQRDRSIATGGLFSPSQRPATWIRFNVSSDEGIVIIWTVRTSLEPGGSADKRHLEPKAFRRKMATLVDELPEGDPRGLFERGCAHDSTGQPDQAIPLYRAALDAGLSGLNRRRANIQMASSLRILEDPQRQPGDWQLRRSGVRTN